MDLTRRKLIHAGGALMLAQQAGRAAANDRIAVGFIGTGARGQELIQAVQKHPGVEIAGLCDAYTGRIERSLDRTNRRPKVYKTHREMLAAKSIDAVIVATPDHLHRSIAVDAMRAGKDVYCERPLTYRSAEGLEIMAVARSQNRILQVGSQGVSSALHKKAQIMINSGWLGTMNTIRAICSRNTVNGAGIFPVPPDASPKTVDWEMFLGPAPKRPYSLERFFRWQMYEDYSGGVATDMFVDIITTIHYLWRVSAPTRVVALGDRLRWGHGRDVPDTLQAIIEYKGGFFVNLSATLSSGSESSLEFLGNAGTLRLDNEGLEFEPNESLEDNRRIVESWPKALEEKYYNTSEVVRTEIEPKARLEKEREEEKAKKKEWREEDLAGKITERDRPHRYKASGPDPTVTHLGHFFESIHTRKPWWEDAATGHRAAACAHMINRSLKEKRIVEWDVEKDDIRS